MPPPDTRQAANPPAALLAALVVALLAGSVGLQVVRDRTRPPETARDAVLYVPSGAVLQRLALSYDAVLADLYWIRALLHFGGTRLAEGRPKKYEVLYPLLSIATTLDPHFNIAYRFGAFFLSEPPPGGPGRPDQAIALLERGLAARPGKWQYMQDIGFVHYWWRRDYAEAARWFKRAADQPGAPWWLRSLAANTLAEGGDRRASRALWTALAESSDNDWLRREAARRLKQLDTLDAIDQVQAIVQRHIARGGDVPYTWEALVRAGLLRGVPTDATGTPLELGPYTGRITLPETSPLWPLPSEPPPSQAAPLPGAEGQ
jgi:tetratricopeptide (TPR) repeat protein